ncbi:MAG: hypothetical protein FGM57_01225 [Candidatus Taylorbacteria bacterium]|nr:hypothetical protein [Candidatus Taylorbacteria bacterium]
MWRDFFIKNNSVIYILGFIFIIQLGMTINLKALADEFPHYWQIKEYAYIPEGSVIINKAITTPTHIHNLIGKVVHLGSKLEIGKALTKAGIFEKTDAFDLFLSRGVVTTLIFLTLLYLSYIARSNKLNTNYILLALVTIPITLPYIPLIYTDILAVSLIALSFVTGYTGKYFQSAISISLAVLIRQPSIVWILPILFLISRDAQGLKEKFKVSIYHLLVCISFIVFFILNKGVALGDRTSHEISLNLSNIWFFSFVFFVTTIGYFYPALKKAYALVLKLNTKKYIAHLIGTMCTLGIFLLYFYTYEIHHQYNTRSYGWFLRNRLLDISTNILWAKTLFGIFSVCGLIMFLAQAFSAKHKVSEYIFKVTALVSISAMPLIEQRYYIPIFIISGFYLSISEKGFKLHTPALVQTMFNIIIGVCFFYGITHIKFFL